MKLIIFGASGKTGHHLVRQALEKGHEVTAFVRNPERLSIAHHNLHVFKGDVVQKDAVYMAMKGHNVVISTLGANSPLKFDEHVVDGIGHIVNGMEKEGIGRLIYMSFVALPGNKNIPGFFLKYMAPILLKTEIKGHRLKEKIIAQSQLDWTFIHPPALTNGPHIGSYRYGDTITANKFISSVSRADVADLMVRQITDIAYIRKAVRILY